MDLSSDWIQTGELGIAFFAILVLVILVVYVMRYGMIREERLMRIILEITPVVKMMSDNMEHVADELREIKDRMTELENRSRKKNKKPA